MKKPSDQQRNNNSNFKASIAKQPYEEMSSPKYNTAPMASSSFMPSTHNKAGLPAARVAHPAPRLPPRPQQPPVPEDEEEQTVYEPFDT